MAMHNTDPDKMHRFEKRGRLIITTALIIILVALGVYRLENGDIVDRSTKSDSVYFDTIKIDSTQSNWHSHDSIDESNLLRLNK